MLARKHTQQIELEKLKKILAVARGEAAGDLLLHNLSILDLVNGGSQPSCIMICEGHIAGIGLEYLDQEAAETRDMGGTTAVPGFIDGHLHIESSLMHPFEFERLTLPLGTTSVICDPHEITNVMGDEGFSWFLRASEHTHQNLFVQVSSCVPALPGYETNGGEFELDNMREYKQHPNTLGLAEMMNFPGVVFGDESVLEKVDEFSDLNLDGHCPMVRGKWLNAYIAAGIQNCHETVSADEGREKLQKGMSLAIREGSVAKNLDTLAELVTEFSSPHCFLCTDDRNPYEIFHEGHINHLIRKLINENNIPAHVAYRLSSLSAANHFGLKRLGLIAPGRRADMVFLSNVDQVEIEAVFSAGRDVKSLDLQGSVQQRLENSQPPLRNTMQRKPISTEDIYYEFTPGEYNLIQIVENEIVTEHERVQFDGEQFSKSDVRKIVVVERYGQDLEPVVGLVKGFCLEKGAIASSVAHDSHNIIAIGESDEDMTIAVNSLIGSGGGFVVVEDGEVKAQLPLPVAGLMSLSSAEEISSDIESLKVACRDIGITLNEPFLQMAFLALPVIPALKITDKGLVDATNFELIEVKCSG